MSATATASEPFDFTSFQALMIRWKLAEQFLFENPDTLETGKMAIHVLISRDFPVLIQELVRLRPELMDASERADL